MVANGIADVVFAAGITFNVEGAMPKEQVIVAPPVTHNPTILNPPLPKYDSLFPG